MTAPKRLHLVRPTAYRCSSLRTAYCGIPANRKGVQKTDDRGLFRAVANACVSCLRALEGGR